VSDLPQVAESAQPVGPLMDFPVANRYERHGKACLRGDRLYAGVRHSVAGNNLGANPLAGTGTNSDIESYQRIAVTIFYFNSNSLGWL
jgi:hypothetical protein